jgi:hypothetical protein
MMVQERETPGRSGIFGPAYRSDLDAKRLSTQQDRLRVFMLQNSACNRWLTLAEIRSGLESRWIAKFPEASISAQLRHLRKIAFGSHRLEKRRRGSAPAGVYEYLLSEPEHRKPAQSDVFTHRKTGLELFDSMLVDE